MTDRQPDRDEAEPSDATVKRMHSTVKRLHSTMDPWLWLIGLVFAALTGIWVTMGWFIPIKDVDVTVQIDKVIPLELPEAAQSLPLELRYSGQTIHRAAIVEMVIRNFGKTAVGDSKEWLLTLRQKDGARIVILGEPISDPANVRVAATVKGATEVNMAFGLFNPGWSVRLSMMVIDPRDVRDPAFAPPEANVANLLAPNYVDRPLQEWIRDHLVPPLFVLLLPIIGGAFLWERWRDMKTKGSKFVTPGSVAVGLVATAFGALVGAMAIGWVLAWAKVASLQIG